jgi:hypothetical protein
LGSLSATRIAAGSLACLVFALACPRGAGAEGDVILAATQPDVVLVWKTNATIAESIQQHLSGEALTRRMLAHGEALMVAHAAPDSAGRVILKLVYFHDGGLDPSYKIETVAGIDRIGSLEARAADLRAHAAAWQRALAAGKTPPGLTVTLDRSFLDNLNF